LVNVPFLKVAGRRISSAPALALAIARGWLALHESGTYVRFTQAGAELFA
jgi:hypothetical protein